MEKLFTLLALQRQVLETSTRQSYAHLIVNETLRLVSYQQAIFWSVEHGHRIKLEKASGNLVIDDQGPYADDIKKIITPFLSIDQKRRVIRVAHDQKFITVVLFRIHGGEVNGGLWLENHQDFKDAEIQILEELAVTYAHALALFSSQKRYGFLTDIKKILAYKKRIVIAILFILFLPVRQTITAPAEIVAKDAEVVTVPFDGMIEKIVVDPGDDVKTDQVIAVMENSALKAQATIAEQALTVAAASLARLQREALGDPTKKSEITVLESRIAEKKIEYDYAVGMQNNSEIKAQRDGTAIFSDSKKLQGKPVRMGEPIMMIANPAEAELLIRVPADMLIPVEPEAQVKFYLNVSPIFGREASVRNIGYQASPDSGGLLTYKIRATIDNNDGLRIGWQGTAKIKGGWTILSYSILRRPLAAFRHLTGI